MNSMKEEVNMYFLAKKLIIPWKGIFALMVLVGHLWFFSGIRLSLIVDYPLSCFGWMAVNMFFFFSGYGLKNNYNTDNQFGKLKLKIYNFYKFYLVLIVVFAILHKMIDKNIGCFTLIKSMLWGGTIVEFGWFFQTLLLFYIIFYITRGETSRIVCCITMYVILCFFCQYGNWWYISTPGFIIGILVQEYIKKPNLSLKNHNINNMSVCITILLGIVLILKSNYVVSLFFIEKSLLSDFYVLALGLIASFLFTIISLYFMYITRESQIIHNVFFNKLGNYSLGIYVGHAISIFIAYNIKVKIFTFFYNSDFKYCSFELHIPINI